MLQIHSTAIAVDAKTYSDFGGIGMERLRRRRLLAVNRQLCWRNENHG